MGLLSWLFGRRKEKVPAPPRLPSLAERERQLIEVQERQRQFETWHAVTSSWIQALRFSVTGGFAQMRLKKHGRVYTFGGMEYSIFIEWYTASSKGRYFNRELKGRYTIGGRPRPSQQIATGA